MTAVPLRDWFVCSKPLIASLTPLLLQDTSRSIPVKRCFQLGFSLEIDKIIGKIVGLLHLKA